MQAPGVAPRKLLKSCDICKARKVRCSGSPGPCTSCIRRQKQCTFSFQKRPSRANVATQLLPRATPPLEPVEQSKTQSQCAEEPRPASGALAVVAPVYDQLPDLYVDHLLAKAREDHVQSGRPAFMFKGNDVIGGNGNVAFFSEARLLSISTRLQSNKINDLVWRISSVIKSRVKPSSPLSGGSTTLKKDSQDLAINNPRAKSLIVLYFDRVHPMFPFLDRAVFEPQAEGSGLSLRLSNDKAWAALYHCVLALGCQYDQEAGFEPGKGEAWRHFSISLALFRDLLTQPDSLTMLQAMTAMAVFSLGVSCLSIEHVIISEAARRAQNLGRASLTGSIADSYHRVFWVLYSMEKMSSFYFSRNSVFVDCDIVYPIPRIPEAIFGDFDWFLSFARHSRLLSRALTSLFSAGVARRTGTYFVAAINELHSELEIWKMSIPANIRPGEQLQWHAPAITLLRPIVIWTHYMYFSLQLILARTTLHLVGHSTGLLSPSQISSTKANLLDASRAILELTTYIDVIPCTPLWVIAGIPIMALFVLFDLVISNPKHPKIRNSLALLDVAAGHFSRLEFASNGTLPGSLIAEFAHIAREYVNSFHTHAINAQEQPPLLVADDTALSAPNSSNNELHTHGSQDTTSTDIRELDFATLPLEMNEYSPLGTLEFPLYDMTGTLEGQYTLGTHVMDLFTSIVPNMDPIFSQMHSS